MIIENFSYRPEVDGLRAVAVIAVVFFHADLGFSGGFVGVDVFFVISGYLITSLILRDLEAGEFSFLHFWERRARRIIPAAVVMVLVTLMAGWFLLLPSAYANLGESVIWHAVFGANFYFWGSINYFSGAAEELPLLHTWSLAVEEQFYLFVPFILVVFFRVEKLRSRSFLLTIFAVGFLVSLALSIVAVPRMPAAAFYLLPTRAWELLCGSIVAILPVIRLSRVWHESLCYLGLSAILIPCFCYTRQTSFPGFAALPPCLGSALFIWASGSPTSKIQNSKFKIQNLLAARPLVFIGLISYSLYLWHWPLFAFSHYWALEPLSLGSRIGVVAAGILLGVISWRFVETPFRTKQIAGSRVSLFLQVGIVSAAMVVLSWTLLGRLGVPSRFSDEMVSLDLAGTEASEKDAIARQIDLADVESGEIPQIGASGPAPVDLLVWGDSHARALLPAVHDLGVYHSRIALVAWHTSTAPVLNITQKGRYSLKSDSPAFGQGIVDLAKTRKIKDVILVGHWSIHFERGGDGKEKSPGSRDKMGFGEALLTTVRELKRAGCRVWICREVPNHQVNVVKALARKKLFGTELESFATDRSAYAKTIGPMTSLLPELAEAGARFVDPASLLFNPLTGEYRMEDKGVALYYDGHHLTKAGARFVKSALTPIFVPGN